MGLAYQKFEADSHRGRLFDRQVMDLRWPDVADIGLRSFKPKTPERTSATSGHRKNIGLRSFRQERTSAMSGHCNYITPSRCTAAHTVPSE